jgi:hypothetical protein
MLSSANADIATFISDIEKEITAPGISQIKFDPSLSDPLIECLRNSLAEENLHLATPLSDFPDVFTSVRSLVARQHPIMKKFPRFFHSPRVLAVAQISSWIVLYELLLQPPEILSEPNQLFDSLSIEYTELRQDLLDMAVAPHINLPNIISQLTAAALLTFLLRSFPRADLESEWVFIARVESDCRRILLGFSTPELSVFHSAVFEMLPPDTKRRIPRLVGYPERRKGEATSMDLLTSFSHERHCKVAWRDRRGCMLKTNDETDLCKRAMKLKGAAAYAQTHRFLVSKGTSERSDLTAVKTETVVNHAKSIMASHKGDVRGTVEDMYLTERLCTDNLRQEPTLAKPLRFSFGTFSEAPTRKINRRVIVDDDRGLTPSELRKKQAARSKAIVMAIAASSAEMWKPPRYGSAVHKTRVVAHAFFSPMIDFKSPELSDEQRQELALERAGQAGVVNHAQASRSFGAGTTFAPSPEGPE